LYERLSPPSDVLTGGRIVPRSAGKSRKPGQVPSHTPSAGKGLGFYSYTVRDVMTRRVAVVPPEASLAEAAAIMSRRAVSGLPVVGTRGRVVGVLSQKDIVRALPGVSGGRLPRNVFDLLLSSKNGRSGSPPDARRKVLESTRVRTGMTKPAITIEPGASLDEAVRVLIDHGINRLPVLSAGKLVGIVTRHDLLTGLTPGEPVET